MAVGQRLLVGGVGIDRVGRHFTREMTVLRADGRRAVEQAKVILGELRRLGRRATHLCGDGLEVFLESGVDALGA